MTTRCRHDGCGTGVVQTVFEPIVELGSGRVAVFEAVTRFATRDMRAPEEVFAEAGARGLLAALECRAAGAALTALADLPEPLLLAVKASPSTICSRQWARVVAHPDPSRVIVELDENAPVDDYEVLLQALTHLRSLGVRLAVGGVGSGIDRMPHVARLQPDLIKLDPSVVVEAAGTGPLAAHARGVVAYADAVDVPVVAEGLATPADLDAMTRLGVRFGQGPLLAAPRPLDEWSQQFRSRRANAA